LIISGLGFLTADLIQGVTASGISATPIEVGNMLFRMRKQLSII
jgi:hypothetical protein